MMILKIDVLGTKYTIIEKATDEDDYLKNCDGYCDKTSKKIVVKKEDSSNELEDYGVYMRKIMRHEIIHAFLFESGLHENWKHEGWGHDETMIDWIAVQFPKLLKAFKEADCIES